MNKNLFQKPPFFFNIDRKKQSMSAFFPLIWIYWKLMRRIHLRECNLQTTKLILWQKVKLLRYFVPGISWRGNYSMPEGSFSVQSFWFLYSQLLFFRFWLEFLQRNWDRFNWIPIQNPNLFCREVVGNHPGSKDWPFKHSSIQGSYPIRLQP